MPRTVRCKHCGGHVGDVGELSARKVCAGCCEAAITSAIEQMRAKRGPIFERYRAGLTDYVANLYRGETPSTPAMLADGAADLATQADAVLLPSH